MYLVTITFIMEAFNLLNQLNNIKNDIDDDIWKLSILQKNLELRNLSDNNKELEDRIKLLDSEYLRRDGESKLILDELKVQLSKCDNIIENKDREIYMLNEKIKELMQDNKVFEINLNTLKSKNQLFFLQLFFLDDNLKMDKILSGKEKEKELERKNREFLRQIYDEELKFK